MLNLILDQIMQHFSTDDRAREYLEAVRWPYGPRCPHCGNAETSPIYAIGPDPAKKVRRGLREPAECHSQFTVTLPTILEDSHVPLRKWLVAWYLLCSSKKRYSALQLQRSLELGSYRSAWFMLDRIRYALRDPSFSGPLGGTVEADETYIGGTVHGHRHGYKGNKTLVVTIVERKARVRSMVMERVTGKNLREALREHVAPSATLMTHEHARYRKPGRAFAPHHTANHSEKEYVRGSAHTNPVEGFFSLLKRGIESIYHHIEKPYIRQYLCEVDFRYNTRSMSDGEPTIAGLYKVTGKRLMLLQPNARKAG